MSRYIVVVGDSLLDIDISGTAHRLAPEAPVPVVEDPVEYARPGGAALAAILAARAGHEVVLVTCFAPDDPGVQLRRLTEERVDVIAVPATGSTPVKRRIRAEGAVVSRVHSGHGAVPMPSLPERVRRLMDDAGAVLVSDYAGGLTSVPELRDLLARVAHRTPLVWDPHPRGRVPVPGVWVATPNEREARALAAVDPPKGGDDSGRLLAVTQEAAELVGQWQARAVAVTMGGRGALLSFGAQPPHVFPAPQVSRGGDTCGAGDRFAGATAAALAEGQLITSAVETGVAAASAFVQDGGVDLLVRPDGGESQRSTAPLGPRADVVVAEVRARGGTVVAAGGCFDLLHPGHVRTLQAARSLGDCLIVCINSNRSVHRLKGPGRPIVDAAGRATVLLGLECVDAVVVFDEDTPDQLLRRLRPDVWVKGGDYDAGTLPESDVLSEWGGSAVVVPYVPGWSTTALALAAGATGTEGPR
jgi:rfaE bifunctional protein nucleotidyltransferase chain/domain